MSDPYRFAGTYMRYHRDCFEYDSTLEAVVSFIESGEEFGELSSSGSTYYELTDDGWVRVDDARVEAIITERSAQLEASYERSHAEAQKRPWHVWIVGPENLLDRDSSHPTEEAARVAVAALPTGLRGLVHYGTSRPTLSTEATS